MSFGPKPIKIQDVAIASLGSLIAGFIGSIIILLIVFFISSVISVPGTFEQARLGSNTNAMFPFVLSFVTFIASSITLFLSAKILYMTSPERYKSNLVSYGQLAFFGVLTYICVTPIYIFMGMQNYENIMIVFIVHTLILSFGSSLILEILNNYRYILVGFYGCFVGLAATSIITLSIFSSIGTGQAKLLSLLIMLPLINGLLTLCKGLFEVAYYRYYLLTSLDGLGDIFYTIENEEKELLREEEMKNNL